MPRELRTKGQRLFPDRHGDRPLANRRLNRRYRELPAEAGSVAAQAGFRPQLGGQRES